MTTSGQNKTMTLDEQEARLYASYATVCRSISNYTPSSATFTLTEDQIRKGLLSMAKEEIPEFVNATIEFNPNNGTVMGYVWLDKNSDNLQDKTLTRANNAAFKVNIPRYSQVITNFIKKFAPEGCQRVVADEVKGSNLCAVPIDLEKYFKVEFDAQGIEFKNKFGYNPSSTTLSVRPMCSQNKQDGKYGKLQYLEVTCTLKKVVDRTNPRPVRSFGQ